MTDPPRPPVLLVDSSDPTGAPPPGWTLRDGFALPESPWDLAPRRWVCSGRIVAQGDAEAAVTALCRGVGLAVRIDVQGDVRYRLLEDLHRIGDVGSPPERPPEPVLGAEHRLVLEAVAGGSTLADAGRSLHLSSRTTHRRMKEVRTLLGVSTTTEAVAWWRRTGPAGPASA